MLNDRQHRFVLEYLLDYNATAACKRAGYTEDNANVTGPRLLHVPEIAAVIKQRQGEFRQRFACKAENVLAELHAIAFANHGDLVDERGDYLPLDRIPDLARRAILTYDIIPPRPGADRAQGQVRIRMRDKLRALLALLRWFNPVPHQSHRLVDPESPPFPHDLALAAQAAATQAAAKPDAPAQTDTAQATPAKPSNPADDPDDDPDDPDPSAKPAPTTSDAPIVPAAANPITPPAHPAQPPTQTTAPTAPANPSPQPLGNTHPASPTPATKIPSRHTTIYRFTVPPPRRRLS